jgi:hypothetical protein
VVPLSSCCSHWAGCDVGVKLVNPSAAPRTEAEISEQNSDLANREPLLAKNDLSQKSLTANWLLSSPATLSMPCGRSSERLRAVPC